MKKFNYIALLLMFLSVLSCQKKISTMSSTGTVVFKTLDEFKQNKGTISSCYIEALGGGFFIPYESSVKPDDKVVLRKNDGAFFAKEEFVTQGIVRPEWYGAKGNDKTDDSPAFKKAIALVEQMRGTLSTGPKKYHLSQKISFPGAPRVSGCIWLGNGAILDNEVEVSGQDITIKDINVEDSPGNGFSWNRGQGGYFYNLKATRCAKAGFLLGGKKGAQVAWSSFYSLVAIGNHDGFILDGSNPKSWVNANVCDAFYARSNKNYGVFLKGKVNYNTFNGLHCEGNGKENKELPALCIERARDNTFVGGHLVTTNNIQSSVVVDKGANNVYVGGRYVTGNSAMKKSIDAPNSKIEMSRQVIRKRKKGQLDESEWE